MTGAPRSKFGYRVAVDVPGFPVEIWEGVSGLETRVNIAIATRLRLGSIRRI